MSSLHQRTPRIRVLVNGGLLTTAYQAEVHSNNYLGSDTFSTLIALSAGSPIDSGFWSSETNLTLDIQIALDESTGFVSLVTGPVDALSLDPVRNTVTLQGRDLTALLIDTPTQETFANRTSSEIATILAQRHGLTPEVVTTTTLVGRYYESERESLTLNRFSRATTEWDLLASLALREGYDVFVKARSLYFQPKASLTPVSRVLHLQHMIDLRMARSLSLARDVQVEAKSWNSAIGAATTQTIVSHASAGTSTNAPSSVVCIISPNLTSDALQSMAMQRLDEMIRHERIIEFSMPGDLDLTPRDTILLQGTNTAFDQPYYVDSIKRSFRMNAGFVQRVRASASSPRTITSTSS